MTTKLNTSKWVKFPFSVNGIKFNSAVNPLSQMYVNILSVSNKVFIEMNHSAILEIIGNPATLTLSELENELVRVNEGASEAIIELAGE